MFGSCCVRFRLWCCSCLVVGWFLFCSLISPLFGSCLNRVWFVCDVGLVLVVCLWCSCLVRVLLLFGYCLGRVCFLLCICYVHVVI